jgi:microcin C transport system substrate-binding protein
VRRAFNYAFDFEEMNKQLFFGQYKRISSYFDGTELASTGLPEGEELAILETVRDKVPAEVFTTPYVRIRSAAIPRRCAQFARSARLLKEAGFEVRDRKLVDPAGKPVIVEFLVQDPICERVALFYKPSLERIGMTSLDPHRRYACSMKIGCAVSITTWLSASMGAVTVARQRAAGILGLAGGRPRPAREMPSASRIRRSICPDRQSHLRQGSLGTGRRDQGARSGAAVEFLCGAAVQLSGFALCALGSLQPSEPLPKYARSGLPSLWWYDADKAARIGKRS